MAEFEKALEAFQKVTRLKSDHANAYNYIGYMLAEQGIRLDEAYEAVQKALEIDPDNGAYVDSLGWVYYQKGMVDEAIRELEHAAKLLNSDPIIHEHLGDAYSKKGLIEEAVKHYQYSLELEFKEEVKQKLDAIKAKMKSVKNHKNSEQEENLENTP